MERTPKRPAQLGKLTAERLFVEGDRFGEPEGKPSLGSDRHILIYSHRPAAFSADGDRIANRVHTARRYGRPGECPPGLVL